MWNAKTTTRAVIYTVEGFAKTIANIFFFVIYIFFGLAVTVHCGKICKDDSYGFLLLYLPILWMNGYRTLWKNLLRRQLQFLILYLHILWIISYRTLWKDLQRRQLRCSSSLPTYSWDELLPYTVEGFEKKTAKVFFFISYIFFEWTFTVHCGRICKNVNLSFLLHCLHILWMNGYCTLWKDLQRRQIKFSSSLSAYFFVERLPYNVEGFTKTTANIFFIVIYIFFGLAVTVHCEKICKDDSYSFLLLYPHIIWMSWYRTLCKDLQRRHLRFSSSLSIYFLWMRGYRTL